MLTMSAVMRSFSFGSLIATIRVIAASALFEMRDTPLASSRALLRAKKCTNRAAALRLLPSVSGWSLMSR